MIGPEEPPVAIAGLLRWLNSRHIKQSVAVAGASQLSRNAGASAAAGVAGDVPKILCLSFAEGRRGTHDRNRISNSFVSFINGFL